MKEGTFTGRSREEALLKASQELGVNISDMTYEVIEEETGLFGMFRKDVKVLVRVKDDAARIVTRASYVPGPGDTGLVRAAGEILELQRPAGMNAPVTEPVPYVEPATRVRETAPRSDAAGGITGGGEPQPASAGCNVCKGPDAARVLGDILGLMGVECVVSFQENDESVLLNLAGADCETALGREGEVLAALQFLVNKIINRFPEDRKLVVLDSDGFRCRREQTLGQLARRLGEKAIATGRAVRLAPMTAQDRRLIHLALRDNRKVTTRSEGVGDFRRLLIIPAGFEPDQRDRQAPHDNARRAAQQGQTQRRGHDRGRNS